MNGIEALIGKYVEVVWRDPGEARVSIAPEDLTPLPRGLGTLSTWHERGVLTDIHEGVARIEHSRAHRARLLPTQSDEYVFTFIPVSLIERVTVFEPVGDDIPF